MTVQYLRRQKSTCQILLARYSKHWFFLDIGFNNNEDKLLHLAYGHRENVAVLDKFDVNGVSS